MKCLLLINTSSGNAARVLNDDNLASVLKSKYEVVDKREVRVEDKFDLSQICKGYDAVAVCGGDGTFNSAINALSDKNVNILYVPCGTFNDCAHTIEKLGVSDGQGIVKVDLGEINGRFYTYVAAAGTFTPIGYMPTPKYKKIFKKLTYYAYAFKEYKLNRIGAEINVDGKMLNKQDYTLIMAVNSRYVFGFPFNKIFELNDGNGQLLLIKTPVGAFKLVKMFFLFFRAFFVGFKAEYESKNIKFATFKQCLIKLDKETEFCIDGERLCASGTAELNMHKEKSKIYLIKNHIK